MMHFKNTARASLALAAIATLLAGCSGGGSKSVLPAAPVAGPAQIASGAALTQGSLSINVPAGGLKVIDRSGKTIPATATTLTIFVVNSPAGAGQPIYFPVATCVSLPAPGAGTTTVPFAAPVGNDWIVVAVSTGACATATTLPTQVTSTVSQAITNGAFSLPATGAITAANLATVQVVGNAGTGTFSTQQGILANPYVVNPGGGPGLGAVVLGYPLALTGQTLVGASLSTATAGITSFEMDAIGAPNAMGLPFSLSFIGPGSAGAVPASGSACVPTATAGCNAFDSGVAVTITDNSVGAVVGTLALALVRANGTIDAGPVATAGATPAATITLLSSPQAGENFVVLYKGAGQDVFQTAKVTLTYQGATLGSFNVTNQPQVVTVGAAAAGGTTPAAGILGAFGLAMGFGAAAQGIAYLADNTGTAAGGRVVADSALTPFAANTATVTASAAVANTQFSDVATSQVAATNIWAADANCFGCSNAPGGAYGFYTLANGFAGGAVPAAVTTTAGVSPPFQASVLPPFKAGPVGLAWIPAGIAGISDAATCQAAGCAFGVLYFAANNSIYRGELSTATNVAYYKLIAGTGIAGALGQGNVDNASGLAARFNLGTANFVGLRTDLSTPGAAVANLYLVDPGNGTIRKIGLTGANAVSTVIGAPKAVGITYDPRSKLLYVSNSDSTVASVNPATGTAASFAGQIGAAGTTNGLGQVAYPVQFNAGNAVSTAAGGAVATQYAGIAGGYALVANTNAAAQAAASVASFVAKFNNSQGIAYDYATNAFIWVVDNATPALRAVY